MGSSRTRARGEHVRQVASGCECNKMGKSGYIVIRSPEGRGGAKRGEGREETLSQAAAGFAVENGLLKGLGRVAAPGAGGGSVSVVSGWVCCQVACARPHLREAAGKELGQAPEGMGRKQGKVLVVWGRVSEGSQM